MSRLRLQTYLIFFCFSTFSEANLAHLPRMTFTDEESTMRRMPVPEHVAPVKVLVEGEPDVVTAVGQMQINTLNLRTQQILAERDVEWEECDNNGVQQRDCSYNITVVHKTGERHLFVCGTNGKETVCCNMSIAEKSAKCIPSDKVWNIKENIRNSIIKAHEPSAYVESAGGDDLYFTNSGSQDNVGIHKCGKHIVRPATHDKEQHYVGLLVSRERDASGQDKVYAFYKEKNKDLGLTSEMWLPFVTRVCMADTGGPKNHLQNSWTSQMNARLFCGDPDNRQHFSELVDVATVHADRWQDSRVYALFRNEWGMSAVCIYAIQEIDHIFKTSPFKGSDKQNERPRVCVADSTGIPLETLRMIKMTSEMEQWVQPVESSGPLHISHHNYTHIYVDSFQDKRKNNHTILFLSLHNGGVHKVMQSKNQTFVIADYRPFNHRALVHSIILDSPSRKLYVSSRGHLVQLDVANCAQYGDTCEDCVLARDPYCSWNGAQCAADTHGAQQDVEHGNYAICKTAPKVSQHKDSHYRHSTGIQSDETITLPLQSKYFFQCPITSRHAQYTWHHPESTTPCSSKEQQCLLLIDSMDREQAGTYTCVSSEMDYTKVLARYQLQLGRAVGFSSSRLVWVCLVAALLVLR